MLCDDSVTASKRTLEKIEKKSQSRFGLESREWQEEMKGFGLLCALMVEFIRLTHGWIQA